MEAGSDALLTLNLFLSIMTSDNPGPRSQLQLLTYRGAVARRNDRHGLEVRASGPEACFFVCGGFFVFLVGILRTHAWDLGPWDRMRLHEAILAELIVRIKCHIRILIESL